MKTAHTFLINKGITSISDLKSAYKIKQWLNEFTTEVLKEIFEDGLGKLDENCSKDDLVEEYLRIKKMLQ